MASGGSRGASCSPLDPSGRHLGPSWGRCEPVQVYMVLSLAILELPGALWDPIWIFSPFWLQFAFTVTFVIDVDLICDASCGRCEVDEIWATKALISRPGLVPNNVH